MFFFFRFFQTYIYVNEVVQGLYKVIWSTELNSKEAFPLQCTIVDKMKKNYKRGLIFPILVNWNEFWFYALYPVHQNASFELQISTNQSFHFRFLKCWTLSYMFKIYKF